MKLFVRAFVLSLVATGAIASTHIANNRGSETVIASSLKDVPVPVCPPDDPDACHLDDLRSGK